MTAQPGPLEGPSSDDSVFLLRVDLRSGRLTLAGRLDRRSAHLVHDAVSAMLTTSPAHWTVDVAGLVVGDHSGLRALGTAYRRLLQHDRRMTLSGASPALSQALTRLRLHHHLPGGDRCPSAGSGSAPAVVPA